MTKVGARLIQSTNEIVAFMEGMNAWTDGATMTSNPHAEGSGSAKSWEDGWLQAEKDYAEDDPFRTGA